MFAVHSISFIGNGHHIAIAIKMIGTHAQIYVKYWNAYANQEIEVIRMQYCGC